MRTRRLLTVFLAMICTSPLVWGQKPDLDQIEQSIGYINNLQNPDGGFRPAATDRESDLGAVTTALRALKYFHPQARPRNKDGAVQFVLKCYDPATGSFATKPGGKADVRSTAMGLMAMVELKMPVQKYADAINRYFTGSAKGLGDIYIAAAALAAAELPVPKAADWIAAYEATGNPASGYGKDALDTASAVITVLRLGGTLKHRDAAAHTLLASQREDGGFGKPGEASDLATTYRIMRALYMLKQKPDSARLRSFIARCRNADGGYGVAPGQPSATSSTYFAAIVMHWIDEMQ